MEDNISKQLTSYGDFGEEESWEIFKNNYLTKTPEQRKIDLVAADSWITQYTESHTGVTKELGSLLTRRRELESIHRRLRELYR